MDWHSRYLQQAKWTRALRSYIFKRAGLQAASRVLEVGCGTGAVLSELPSLLAPHGLDIDPAALDRCQIHAPSALLVQGNALHLPYQDSSFDIVYCHFLLLWLAEPREALREMKRVAGPGAHVIAFAEPDYTARVDEPPELRPLGGWQIESLRRQGADPGRGAELAELFFRAGIRIVETGPIQSVESGPSAEDWETEWAVIESDLRGLVSDDEIQNMKRLDQAARARGERTLYIPTYFAWGQA